MNALEHGDVGSLSIKDVTELHIESGDAIGGGGNVAPLTRLTLAVLTGNI
jgi:hypothetical protein